MAQKNGYFQLIVKDNSTYIKIFPASDQGVPVNFNELIQYLENKKAGSFDIVSLKKEVMQAVKITEIKLNDQKIDPVDESLSISIARDKMKAVARFYPPSDRGQLMTIEDIVKELFSFGVKAGIDKFELECFVNRREYCKDFVVAKGASPVQGKDAVIQYLFNTNPNSRPKLREDGTVDYHELENISHVKAGDVLAVLTREVQGQSGYNITGEALKPKEVKRDKLKFGRNITLSEDGLSIITKVSGHATLVDDKVFVSNVYDVSGDVDSSTGDIDYDGNVMVKGNVRSGFSLKATGNIEILGVVEGAVLHAGGQIILRRGIQGMGKGVLQAKGNIVAKFIENANVNAGGSLEAGSILHSRVSVKGDINVTGKKGFITGGVVRASNLIIARTIGSTMGTDTLVEVGIDPLMKERYQELKKNIRQSQKTLEQMRPVLTSFGKRLGMGEKISKEKMKYIQTLSSQYKQTEQTLKENSEELSGLAELFTLESNSRIKVMGVVYPGTRLAVSDAILHVREELYYCQFVREEGEVKMHAL